MSPTQRSLGPEAGPEAWRAGPAGASGQTPCRLGILSGNPEGWPDMQGLVGIIAVPAPLGRMGVVRSPDLCMPLNLCLSSRGGRTGSWGKHRPLGPECPSPVPSPIPLLTGVISEISLSADITRTGKVKPAKARKDQVPLNFNRPKRSQLCWVFASGASWWLWDE